MRTAPPWDKALHYTRRGKRKILTPCGLNAGVILRHHPDWAGVIAYDAFAERIIVTRKPPWLGSDISPAQMNGHWGDPDTTRLCNWFTAAYGIDLSPAAVDRAVEVQALTQPVHPVRRYLKATTWDKKPRLANLVPTYLGGEDSPYTRGVGLRWMISAVARVMSPGCQVDYTIVLESAVQGMRKSSALRALVPVKEWYSETPFTLGDKDSYQGLHGVWIVGLEELDSIRRSENSRTKCFLTSTQDSYRPSYGRHRATFARQNVFAGTTNDETYFSDPSGNRRYWPVKVKEAKVELIIRDRNQLWAEATYRYRRGEKWWDDTAEFRALCEAEQARRMMPDGWEEPFTKWLQRNDNGEGVTTHAALTGAFPDMRPEALNRSAEMRAGVVFRTLGYERLKAWRAGRSVWVYRLADEQTREKQAAEWVRRAGKVVAMAGRLPSQPTSQRGSV